MRLLALDTATEACSVALNLDGVIHARFELAARRHTQRLSLMMHELLDEAGIELRDLDLLAFTQGPGSFTGLRIAAGLVQGLALGLGRPVIGVSTLAVMAHRCLRLHQAQRVAVAMDARMGQVYWGEYAQDAEGQCLALRPDQLCNPAEVPRLDAGDWQLAGNGWERYRDWLMSAAGLPDAIVPQEIYPHAEDLAALAGQESKRSQPVPAPRVQPVYLRHKVAEKAQSRNRG